jgi:pimeloyl-ACP methyl ester carboxylesterase
MFPLGYYTNAQTLKQTPTLGTRKTHAMIEPSQVKRIRNESMHFLANILALLVVTSISNLFLAATTSAAENGFERIVVDVGYAEFVSHVWEPDAIEAETVFALPGSGADVSRYQHIGPILAEAGYRLVAINQRGIMGSTGSLDNLSLHDLAADVIAIADELDVDKFHMAGWAFGNRTSRMLATDFPDRLASLTLIAAGGLVPALTQPGELARLLDEQDLPEEEKIHLARQTMFSAATDDAIVRNFVRGLTYWPEARAAQGQANRNTQLEEWSDGGTGAILMIMGADDLTAPLENGHLMKEQHGDRLTLVIVDDAAHAMGLEKPDTVATAMLQFLNQYSL